MALPQPDTASKPLGVRCMPKLSPILPSLYSRAYVYTWTGGDSRQKDVGNYGLFGLLFIFFVFSVVPLTMHNEARG